MHLSAASQLARERVLRESKEEVQISGSGVTPTCHAGQRGAGDGMQVTATWATTSYPHLQGSIAGPLCPLPALRHHALTYFSYPRPPLKLSLHFPAFFLSSWGACPE